ncbi:hypothetical protein QPX45_04870 [Corynebacterium propinquum]|uniref:Uncharacterized protein n=1 Tax=Corynebacterium propinquum TaxID=43769 RepID=A0ABT7G268_9CORY|nr:hypothetical protein [Corynebacterium propinquum]
MSTNEALQNSLRRSLNFPNVSRGTSHTEQNYRDPEQSPAGASTTTEPLADDIVAHNRQLVTNYADALYDASAEDILAWADEHVPGDIALPCPWKTPCWQNSPAAMSHAPGPPPIKLPGCKF